MKIFITLVFSSEFSSSNTCEVCLHRCTSCVELQFSRGSGKCEVCKLNLKKGNFRPQMFLSAEVERGVFIRKRILKEWVGLKGYIDAVRLRILFNQIYKVFNFPVSARLLKISKVTMNTMITWKKLKP